LAYFNTLAGCSNQCIDVVIETTNKGTTDMTLTDRLFDALKVLGIETEPTDTKGRLAWYTASGEYLGTHGIADGFEYLQDLMKRVDRL